ncbi:MAG: aminoacyl-tRNA hydrolase [Kiritimatiellae bacterium]|nr:aminoacyl-tRNA hydrolase [Kiritimatiellia bacterium]
MKILAGLGNPGKEYESTPHSIGFEVADAVVREMAAAFRKVASFKGELADGRFANGKLLVVKPMTFMNLSGDSVAPVVKYHNATAADLVVVSDDIDLPVGRIRIRKGGSAGGHNGLKSVIERLGTQDFIRLKIGVGRDRNDRSKVIGHVLGKFDRDTRALMDSKIVPAAVKAVEQIFMEGPDAAMNVWNGWAVYKQRPDYRLNTQV